MSTSDHNLPQARQSRVAIIHLLGWMAGVAVALAFYKNFSDWSELEPEEVAQAQFTQLAFGLAYGTALSGLGLVLWRRIAGGFPFPSQPGHWLLVVAALGFVLVEATEPTTRGMQRLGWIAEGRSARYFAQHSLLWFTILAGSMATMFLWSRLGRWRWVAVAAALLSLANGIAHLTAELVLFSSAGSWIPYSGGTWPWYVPLWSRAYGMGICLAVLLLVAYADRHGRDWLHWVGVTVVFLLALTEVVQVVATLMRFG